MKSKHALQLNIFSIEHVEYFVYDYSMIYSIIYQLKICTIHEENFSYDNKL